MAETFDLELAEESTNPSRSYAGPTPPTLDLVQFSYVRALLCHGYSQAQAARFLGIDRKTLYLWIKGWTRRGWFVLPEQGSRQREHGDASLGLFHSLASIAPGL